ncbi:MAG: N-formylglutamate amidohydrolase [Pontixanthobacter sp.]
MTCHEEAFSKTPMQANVPGDRHNSVEEGGAIPGSNAAAFTFTHYDAASVPIVIAVPHAGRAYPETLLREMRDPAYSCIRLEDRYVDRIARAVAARTGAPLLVANAPRAMLDLNRAPADVDWGMVHDVPADIVRHSSANRRARSGLGLVPRRLPELGELWSNPLAYADLQDRIDLIHTPYHAALAGSLDRLRDIWGSSLLIDLHSMPPLTKRSGGPSPAKFVIGDRFGASANDMIVAAALRHFADDQIGVAHNRPYAGGYVLDRHGAPLRNIHAVQLEICRSLYLDEEYRETKAGLDDVVETLVALIGKLGREVAQLAASSRYATAAE